MDLAAFNDGLGMGESVGKAEGEDSSMQGFTYLQG